MLTLLRTLSFGYVRQHRTRTALIILSIALGVAAMVATQALNRSLKAGLQDGINPLAGLADLLVVNGSAGVPSSLAERIRGMGIEGLKDARPFVQARVSLADLDNQACWLIGAELPEKDLLTENALDVKAVVTYKAVDFWDGARLAKALAGAEVAFVTPGVAAQLAELPTPITKEVRLRNAGRTPSFLLLGTVDFSRSKLPVKEQAVVILEVQAASRVCYPEKPGQVQQINVTLEPGAVSEAVRAELKRRLAGTADVQSLDASRELVSDATAGMEIGLAVGGIGALVVGMFLVFNALSVNVAERRHDIGILRAVGATRRQIAGLFLGESFLMGLAGSLLGLPAGWLLAWVAVKPLAAVIGDLLVPVDSPAVNLPVWLMIMSVAAGTLVACLAALVPAIQASREEPADAVRRTPKRDGFFLALVQTTAVAILLGGGAVMVVWRASLPPRVGMFAGIVALLVGGLVATPLLAALIGRLVQPLFRHMLGLEGRLAADNLVRSPGRTGLVIAALAATGALLVQTSGFLKSTREAVTEWIDEKIAADLFVTCGSTVTSGGNSLTMREEMGRELTATPGVDVAMPIRYQRLDWTSPRDGRTRIIFVLALETAAFDGKGTEHVLGKVLARMPRLRERGTVAISENFAALYGVKIGDRIRLPVLKGVAEAEVVGFVTDYSWNRGTVVMDRPWFKELFLDGQADIFDVFLKPGADRAVVKSAIEKRFGRSDAVFVMARQEIYDEVAATMNKVYSLAYAQQLIVGVVALLGVVSALFISVLQRKRELGLLRAVGATRGQILRSVLAEAILMGIVGAAVGFVIGLALEWYAINVIIFDESGFLFPLRVPWVEAGVVSLGSVALATLAGLWPAYLATTLRIPDAIAYE